MADNTTVTLDFEHYKSSMNCLYKDNNLKIRNMSDFTKIDELEKGGNSLYVIFLCLNILDLISNIIKIYKILY